MHKNRNNKNNKRNNRRDTTDFSGPQVKNGPNCPVNPGGYYNLMPNGQTGKMGQVCLNQGSSSSGFTDFNLCCR